MKELDCSKKEILFKNFHPNWVQLFQEQDLIKGHARQCKMHDSIPKSQFLKYYISVFLKYRSSSTDQFVKDPETFFKYSRPSKLCFSLICIYDLLCKKVVLLQNFQLDGQLHTNFVRFFKDKTASLALFSIQPKKLLPLQIGPYFLCRLISKLRCPLTTILKLCCELLNNT